MVGQDGFEEASKALDFKDGPDYGSDDWSDDGLRWVWIFADYGPKDWQWGWRRFTAKTLSLSYYVWLLSGGQ